jgi:sigma-B regulation protein RsbU (phosphoserine phosphatase)
VPKRRHLIAAVLLCGWLFLDITVQGVETVRFLRRSSTTGWMANWKGDLIRISQVRPDTAAQGLLRRGDEIVAVNGRGVSQGFDTRLLLEGVPPGTEYRLLLRRDGRLQQLKLHSLPFGLSFTTFFVVALIPLAALFLLAGIAVLAVKPHDLHGFLLALMFALLAAGMCQPHVLHAVSGWKLVVLAVGLIASNFFWPVLLHFFLIFPVRSAVLRRFPALEYRLYWPSVAWLPLAMASTVLFVKDRAWEIAWASQPRMQWLSLPVTVGYVFLGLLSLVLNYRQATLAAKRKLTMVVAGSLAAFLPLAALMLVELLGDITAQPLWVARALLLCVILCMPLLPLSFAYAIFRHQVIPIRLLIRRGFRYLLVSRGFYLIEAVAVLATIGYLLTGERAASLDRVGNRADVIATLVVGSAVFALLQLLNRRLMPAIDRRFLREVYDSQAILAEIGAAAREVPSITELLTLAASRIEDAFHPESLAVFLQQARTGDYQSVLPPGGYLSAEAPLIRQLKVAPGPRESERGGISLAIVAKQDLLGVIVLGPRLGDLPYSGEDRRLLEAITWQLAFAIENSQLVQRRAEEEFLRREIAMASEVQRRLFPDRPPESARLELAGLCRPAQAVGGDYYDFLRLGEGRLGIAVADVAGKGISAALLMSVVQASLRSQAGSVAPGQLVAAMNGLLYRSAERNRFASFFYAEFAEHTGQLTYVNAGHNPPLLFRASRVEDGLGAASLAQQASWPISADDGGVAVAPELVTALRLSTGGLVIGALQRTTYEECRIHLQPGDFLVAYTDGITEAFSPEGEEFGEERLEQALWAASERPAAGIVEAVVQAVDEFAHGMQQHDDMTMVVAKVR